MLHPSTLGYEIATPTELPGVRPVHHKPHPNLPQRGRKKAQMKAPSQPSPRGRCAPQPPQTQRERIPAPWGGLGRGLQSAVFLPPKADFLNGQRPLFEPCRLLSSCKAWRWGWWRRQGGKLVFRLTSPTPPQKAKPTTTVMDFCVYINLYYVLLQVTPSANRNSFRVALICSELHPG